MDSPDDSACCYFTGGHLASVRRSESWHPSTRKRLYAYTISDHGVTAAARMRRSRERHRRGALCIRLEIGWSDLDALGALGLLDTDEADPVKISGAVRAHLDQSLTTSSRPARTAPE